MHEQADEDMPKQAGKPKENRRRVRVLDTLRFDHPKIGMRREISPRKVKCHYCGTAVQGNDEERIAITFNTGFGGEQFWRRWKTIYFHPQCLISFATGGKVPFIRAGERLVHSCTTCYRYGYFRVCSDGEYRCRYCRPHFEALFKEMEDAKAAFEAASSDD